MAGSNDVNIALNTTAESTINLFSSQEINLTDTSEFVNHFMVQVTSISLVITIVAYLIAGLIILAAHWEVIRILSSTYSIQCCCCCPEFSTSEATSTAAAAAGRICGCRCCSCARAARRGDQHGDQEGLAALAQQGRHLNVYVTRGVISFLTLTMTVVFGIVRWLPVIVIFTCVHFLCDGIFCGSFCEMGWRAVPWSWQWCAF